MERLRRNNNNNNNDSVNIGDRFRTGPLCNVGTKISGEFASTCSYFHPNIPGESSATVSSHNRRHFEIVIDKSYRLASGKWGYNLY